jgi:hypothetical protein
MPPQRIYEEGTLLPMQTEWTHGKRLPSCQTCNQSSGHGNGESGTTMSGEEKTTAVNIKAVVRAMLTETKKTSAEAKKKDF